MNSPKPIQMATDFFDEVIGCGGFPDKEQLEAQAAWIASLGVAHVEWVDESFMGFYNDYPGGFDLFETYAAAVHRQGMTISAVIKPFEITEDLVPQTFPDAAPGPDGPVFRDSLWGRWVVGNSLAMRRPELGFQIRPGDWNPPGPVTAIRLVGDADRPTGLAAADLSVWAGERNGEWIKWEQPFALRETSEWRNLFPSPKVCRVLSLEGLAIPDRFRYVEVRVAPGRLAGFVNDVASVIELLGPGGARLPVTPPAILTYGGRTVEWLLDPVLRQTTLYGRDPAVRRFLADPAAVRRAAEGMRFYGHKGYPVVPYDVGAFGRVHAARGRDAHYNILHPIYPEVRAFWLDRTRSFLARGADAVNFRHCSHFRDASIGDYGFNPPVLEATGGSLNRAEVARVNGAAYTRLLREASSLVRGAGKRFGVHLSSEFMRRSDDLKLGSFLDNIDMEWKTWIRELADFAVFRGAMGNRMDRVQAMIDRFGLACREAGIPLVYQANRRHFRAEGPFPYHDEEMAWVLAHPDVAAYQLYESASLLRWKEGRFTGSTAIRGLLAKHGAGK